jgi:threonylcarbamoyladenosine tRNA methylthiotransferase MtaB
MKVFLKTYGCRANHYDTEALRGLLAAEGIEEVEQSEDADYAVFNSCSVTSSAEADLRRDIRRASRANPALRSVVMGCAPGVIGRNEASNPLRSLPSVDGVVAGADLPSVGAALGIRLRETNRPAVQTGARALLRIQEGCDEHCTFCVTTIARGENRSRPERNIIAEAQRLADTHPEIVLTGIHIGSYGSDTGTSLGELIKTLVSETDSVRFRLTSIEATEVDDTLVTLFADSSGRVVPHLHAPLQSGSDRILRRMGRTWYNAARYAECVNRIVGGRDVFALSGDVITGFPGETEHDHRCTVDLIESLPFTGLHVFPFSPRPGTAASRLGEHVPQRVGAARATELRALAARKSAIYENRRLGGNADVVVIERGSGLTEDYLSVDISDHNVSRRSRFAATLSRVEARLTATPRYLG